MKTNKKGFTLVELVIVIAVIAILAGVMIAIFSNVIKRANESAELQQVKNEELAQKADDVIKKIDNANWFSWEDFENSLAAKMTEVYKANAVNGETTSAEDLQKAVKAALKEYFDNNAKENTSLTEAQVKAIVENALANAKLGGVTEAQVRTIVNTAVAGIETVNKTDVQKIVDAAVAKGLTAQQVAQVIGQSKLASKEDVTALDQKITEAINAINALKPATAKDIEDKIISLLPVTYPVGSQEELEAALEKVNSFSTLNFTAAFDAKIELGVSDNRTLKIAGVKLTSLEITAPVANIYLVSDEGNVIVNSVADHSLHVNGTVDSLTIKDGRAVVEEGAKVTTLVAAPAKEALVKVVIENGASVASLEANYQRNEAGTKDFIEVENNGTVGSATLTVVEGDAAVTTNVKVTGTGTGTDAKTVADATTTAGLVIKNETVKYTTQTGAASYTEEVVDEKALEGSGTEADPYLIRTVEELKLVAALVNNGEHTGKYYKLTANLDISDTTWTPIGDEEDNQFEGYFDGNGKTITGLNNKASFEYVGKQVITITTKKKVNVYGLFGWIKGTSSVKNLTMADVSLSLNNGSGVGAIAGYVGSGDGEANITFEEITVSGNIVAYDNAGGIAGRCLYGKPSKQGTVTFTSCVNNATITSTRTDDSYARAGGIAAYVQNTVEDQAVVFENCENTATITGRYSGTKNTQYIGQIYGYRSGTKGTCTVTSCVENGTVVNVAAK